MSHLAAKGGIQKEVAGTECNQETGLDGPLGVVLQSGRVNHLFVHVSNPSASSQRQDTDQKAINTHVQRVSIRNKKIASARWLRAAELPYPTWRQCHCSYIDTRQIEARSTSHRQTLVRRAARRLPELCPRCNSQLSPGYGWGPAALSPLTLLEGNTDPFATMASTMTHTMFNHLHHYTEVLCPLTFPVNTARLGKFSKDNWVPLAMTDSAMMQSTIAMGAIHRLLAEGHSIDSVLRGRGGEYMKQKTNAIQKLNQRLANEEEAISDTTICTVIMLAGCEAMTGNAAAIDIHLNGLVEIVRRRNGIRNLSKVAAQQIALIDTKVAAATSSLPRFERYTLPESKRTWTIPWNLSDFAIDPHLVTFGSRLSSRELSSIFPAALQSLFSDLKKVVIFSELCKDPRFTADVSDMESAQVQENVIEHTLLSNLTIIYPQASGPNAAFISLMTECCRLAALLFTSTALWVFQSNSGTVRGPVERLQQTLAAGRDILLDPLYEEYSDVLMWVFFIGGHAAAGQIERAWFAAQIVELAWARMGLRRWEGARGLLRGCLYSANIYEFPFQLLWAESLEIKGAF